MKITKGKPIGKVMWTVESYIEPVTFYKKKDAKHFADLLNARATANYNAAIIRREITEEGFIPTHGDENVTKN